MSVRVLFAALAAVALAPASASAQNVSPGYSFLKAVKDGDGTKVTDLIASSSGSVINATDDKGEGALDIVVRRQDATYLRFLLAKGADPNIQDDAGNTPAMLAVENNFPAAIDILSRYNANFNLPNKRGETPLIRAVQMHQVMVVRDLLAHGANPDQPDNIAGMSARDYAKRDRRSPAILKAIEEAPKKTKNDIIGPTM